MTTNETINMIISDHLAIPLCKITKTRDIFRDFKAVRKAKGVEGDLKILVNAMTREFGLDIEPEENYEWWRRISDFYTRFYFLVDCRCGDKSISDDNRNYNNPLF